MENKGRILKKIIWCIALAIIICVIVAFLKKYNYNDYIKNISEVGKTNFTRDSEVKYSKMDSYKIENIDYHDAMFSKTVSVVPNTPYKVTCKVKVENVVNENNTKTGGAHISVNGTTERSDFITGTTDWQELAVRSAARMLSASALQQTTFSHTMRPFCRSPMFTHGTPIDGVSARPDDELPATTAQYFIAERYRSTPILANAMYFSGCAAQSASMRSLIAAPPASALALVKMAARPHSAKASHSASNCATGEAPPTVSG